jgi:predicted nucleic acid-binding protein
LSYLLDTNVVSELRKKQRCDPGLRRWFEAQVAETLFISVLVLGEIRKGIETIRRRDPAAANALDQWLAALTAGYRDRILPVGLEVAETWGRLGAQRPLPVIDGLMAATARHHGLTFVTRNTQDIAHLDVPWLNPFANP